jgi:hypothetical protein
MRRCWWLVPLVLAAGVRAQTTPAGPTAARILLADVAVIQTLDALGVTPEQATRLAALCTELQTQFANVEAALTVAAAEALGDMRVEEEALRGNRPIERNYVLRLRRYEARRAAAEEQCQVLVEAMLLRVVEVLSTRQRTLLRVGDSTVRAERSADPAEVALQAQPTRFAYEQSLTTAVLRLLNQARSEQRAERFARRGPEMALEAAASLTNLPADEPAIEPLAQFLLNVLQRARAMDEDTWREESTTLARQMTRAAMYVGNQRGAMAKANGERASAVTTRDLESVLRYARAPLLLTQISRLRVNPLLNR